MKVIQSMTIFVFILGCLPIICALISLDIVISPNLYEAMRLLSL